MQPCPVYFDFCAVTVTTRVIHSSWPTLTCEFFILALFQSYHISTHQYALGMFFRVRGQNSPFFKLESVYAESSLPLFLMEQTNDNVAFPVLSLLPNVQRCWCLEEDKG